MWLLTTACIEGWKICAIEKPFIDASLVIMTNNNRCLFSSQGSFALSKNAHLPGITVNEATFYGLRWCKAQRKSSLLTSSDLIAATSNYSFCDPQHKMLFVAYEGEKNLWKTIAFTKWRPARREKVDVNQLFEMINTCILNFKILIK